MRLNYAPEQAVVLLRYGEGLWFLGRRSEVQPVAPEGAGFELQSPWRVGSEAPD